MSTPEKSSVIVRRVVETQAPPGLTEIQCAVLTVLMAQGGVQVPGKLNEGPQNISSMEALNNLLGGISKPMRAVVIQHVQQLCDASIDPSDLHSPDEEDTVESSPVLHAKIEALLSHIRAQLRLPPGLPLDPDAIAEHHATLGGRGAGKLEHRIDQLNHQLRKEEPVTPTKGPLPVPYATLV